MADPADDIELTPVDRATERLRAIYRNWNRDTSVAQMRSDWDAAFAGCSVAVQCRQVSADGVDAEWIAPPAAPHDKAILYFHGGGFRIGSVASHRDLIARLAEAAGCRVLAIDYRLAPEHRFPAALEDAQTAYRYLRDQGLRPADIAFAGDSAGGNLVLAAMVAARDAGDPLPAAAVLMSPWTDLAATGASYQSRAAADPIHQRAMILALAKNYLGAGGDPRHPLASPLYADLAGLPPLFIQAGDRETVRDDATVLAAKAKAAGVDVELEVWDGMIHVFQMFPEIPEAREAISRLAAFLRQQLHIRAERAP
ncbi:alpha/beta hydrolase [Bradyrhizobium sp. CCBAU 51753]|uniref:alpha/beta hydrolase n=1 Tax=Bradyrhizobium sp. CCBAU 51753 TaxID=1325100 RepID=UPI00188BA188|nr:alpha/beta hydrolase [Bradyrhizobium sp. CCBAU 51753]QOZ28024.1 alpha/beta hydrolase [Bradyrhizobium sp. CCBAU 51753]